MRVIWRFKLLPPPEVTTLHLPIDSQLRAFGYQRLGGREPSFNAWFHVDPEERWKESHRFSIHATGEQWDQNQWGDVETFLDPQTGLVWTLLKEWQ